MISWRNPDIALCNLTWDDYIKSGIIQSINVVKDISGQNKINCFGFCVGGTLLSCALAALAKKNINPTASLTLITTFLDFYDTGILDVYVDEVQVALHEQAIGKGGLLPGRELAMTFSSLRPNDLIWPYVQSNYLKGEDPDPFDLLFWNSDSTNLPGPMFCWYLRNAYLENKLCQPNEVNVVGEGLDFSLIDTPCFIYASKDDHIVPWKSAYANLSILNVDKPEKNKFILGASGHIAGVINSPIKNKRCYWESNTYSKNSEQWFQSAKEVKGSWWPAWLKFLNSYAGDSGKPSLKLGNSRYNVIEAAPGNYVKSTCN